MGIRAPGRRSTRHNRFAVSQADADPASIRTDNQGPSSSNVVVSRTYPPQLRTSSRPRTRQIPPHTSRLIADMSITISATVLVLGALTIAVWHIILLRCALGRREFASIVIKKKLHEA